MGVIRTLVFIVFFLLINFPYVSAIDDITISFNNQTTQYVNVSINYASINGFSFNVTGSIHNSSYPSNITIDVGNDSLVDWKYDSYHSNVSAMAEIVTAAWSSNPDSAEIYFRSNMTDGDNGIGLGYILNNIFQKYANTHNGTLGVANTGESVNEQIISITANTTLVHAFLPALSGHLVAGLYVAEGGSTYYCNSDHTFANAINCNLTVSEAMVSAHLARESNIANFSLTEPVTNEHMKDTINTQLAGCELPCNITIAVTSATAGNITLSDFQVINSDSPANITISENSTHYNINLSPYNNLTSVRYFYGTMPTIYIIPVVARDDIKVLTVNQSLRLDMLNNTLREAWDNLTNSSHPLDFKFYMAPFVINYSVAEDNYVAFRYKAREKVLSEVSLQSPAILAILDIYDYFPNNSYLNSRTTLDENGMISQIYMNGFSDENNKTLLYNYTDEILRNIFLHEIAHTFIFYPSKDKLFYSDHPSSFTNLTDFETYNISESPTGNEGYYEIYSILNQIRPYILNDNINVFPALSVLDKMLLGILSPYTNGNHTFYSGNITKSDNQYMPTTMTPIDGENASYLYTLYNDESWWDVRNTTATDMNLSESFSVAKQNQSNRSLWVFAADAGYPDHFKMFNLNSNSNQTTFERAIEVNLTSPSNNSIIANTITFNCSAFFDYNANLTNITLYGNWSLGWHANETKNLAGASNSTTFTKNITDGIYLWNCLAYNNISNSAWGNNNYTLTVDSTSPTVNLVSPTNNTSESSSNTIVFTYNVSDANSIPNCSLIINGVLNQTNTSITKDANQTFTQTLSKGNYNWSVNCTDTANNRGASTVHNISVLDTASPIIILISPRNNTGDSDGNITFNYNVSDESSISNCSLIFSNQVNQTNSSITKDTTQNFTLNNLAVGLYNWSINCTDSANNTNNSETRIFSVVLTTEFSGDTTDLTQVNISNITNLIIDKPSHGKINFSRDVSLSSGADIDTHVNISNNRIEINSTALPALNKPARLRLYNLTYSNPRPLKDEAVCSDCVEVSYTGGIFIFNVTSFSIYSAGETPTTPTTTPSGGRRRSSTTITTNVTANKTTEVATDEEEFIEENKTAEEVIKEKNEEEVIKGKKLWFYIIISCIFIFALIIIFYKKIFDRNKSHFENINQDKI